MVSSLKDNRSRGKVGDFLKNCLKKDSRLSFVSAYFTIYAYDKLKDHLHQIDHLDFLFGEPASSETLIPTRPTRKPLRSKMKT
jgi:hypothetical protein